MYSLETALGDLNLKIGTLTRERDAQLEVLGQAKVALEAAIQALNGKLEAPEGQTLIPSEKTLLNYVMYALADGLSHDLNNVTALCESQGWSTKGERPSALVGSVLRKLVAASKIRRTGKPKHYRYRLV